MKTKIRHVVLALALCGTLGACGGPPPGDPNSGSTNGGLTNYGNGNSSGFGNGSGNASGSYSGVCTAEGTWSDTDGNTHTETALGGGDTVDDARNAAIRNCNSIVETSVATFNGSMYYGDNNEYVGATDDINCHVTDCT